VEGLYEFEGEVHGAGVLFCFLFLSCIRIPTSKEVLEKVLDWIVFSVMEPSAEIGEKVTILKLIAIFLVAISLVVASLCICILCIYTGHIILLSSFGVRQDLICT